MDRKELLEKIDAQTEEMIGFLAEMVAVPAIGPLSGGTGETEKAELIETRLRKFGLTRIGRHDAADNRVPSGFRPNISVTLKSRSAKRRLVIIAHLDVVPPGDLSEWNSEPFGLRIEDGKAIGRGVEDNGQAMTASIFALKTLTDLGIVPDRDIVLFLVSDEEETNMKGIGHLVREKLITKDDLILVPDHGEPTGTMIELVEKSLLWMKIEVRGGQCHASMPHLGKNALRASMMFGSRVDSVLHERFHERDDSFDHPICSFEPTSRSSSGLGINVIPGEDVFHFDCRLLPTVETDDVISEMKRIAAEVEEETGTSIELTTILREKTLHPTSPDAPIVRMLSNAIRSATGKESRTAGIGGGTCAAILRNEGFEVAVWETVMNQAHAPNEYILIDNLVNDCKVLAELFTQSGG